MKYSDFGLHAKSLKCIGEEPQGFDEVRTINVVIGRNNAGKSSLLDLVYQATAMEVNVPESNWHRGQQAAVLTTTPLTELELSRVFPVGHSGGMIAGNHQAFGLQLKESRVVTQILNVGAAEIKAILPAAGCGLTFEELMRVGPEYARGLALRDGRNPFRGKQFQRLAAERNVRPEADSSSRSIQPDGTGATNLIQHFINKVDLSAELVQVEVLAALNEVFGPDCKFTGITCRHFPSNEWEIFLSETSKGGVALSQSGSGLKTVILAICFVRLLPVVQKRPVSDFVFAFEELENNLHPALLRRLLSFLASEAVEKDFPIFLTTHSSVAIDMFNRNPNAQIVHVTHDGTSARARTVRAYVESRGILDDLDVRASDLLQSNGIIWVEGPSDRIYVNRWVDLWSDGELKEGIHYQCVFYGGRLLAHISGDVPDDESEHGVSILRVNRNAALLIDSDKRKRTDSINRTKSRVIEEIESIGGMAWLTEGREVENYVPRAALAKLIGVDALGVAAVPQIGSFFDYLDRIAKGKIGTYYAVRKPLLAEQISSRLSKEDLATSKTDLPKRLTQLCRQIRRWNSLPENI